MGPVPAFAADRRPDRAPTIAAVSELGLGGDWFTHTGETTIFGIVTAPEWHSDVYEEASQFAISWLPRLRLWSKTLDELQNSGCCRSAGRARGGTEVC